MTRAAFGKGESRQAVGLRAEARVLARVLWLRKNRAALKAFNEHVKKHGVFSDGLRLF